MAVSRKVSNVIVPITDRKLAFFSIFHLVDCGYFCKNLFVDVFVAKQLWHSEKDNTLLGQSKNFH